MALTTCPECSAQVSDKAYFCPSCGFPFENDPDKQPETVHDTVTLSTQTKACQAVQAQPTTQIITVRKSRGVFIILGVLFGLLGIHNFYAGFYGQGTTQLILGLITIGLPWMFMIPFLTAFILLVWVIADLIMTTHDSNGIRMG